MHIPFLFVNALLCLSLPIVLGLIVRRRFGMRWGLFFWGALTFILSQVVHIPLNFGVSLLWSQEILPPVPDEMKRFLLPLALGLSAGLCEEGARWLFLRTQRLSEVRDWGTGLMYGAGHGGIEAFIVGVLGALGAVNVVMLSGMDLNTLGLSPDQLEAVQGQLDSVFEASPFMILLGSIERLCAMTAHVAMALMVVESVRSGHRRWLLAAIGFHTFLNASAVFALKESGPIMAEVMIGIFALLAIGIIVAMRKRMRGELIYCVEELLASRRHSGVY